MEARDDMSPGEAPGGQSSSSLSKSEGQLQSPPAGWTLERSKTLNRFETLEMNDMFNIFFSIHPCLYYTFYHLSFLKGILLPCRNKEISLGHQRLQIGLCHFNKPKWPKPWGCAPYCLSKIYRTPDLQNDRPRNVFNFVIFYKYQHLDCFLQWKLFMKWSFHTSFIAIATGRSSYIVLFGWF